MMSEPAGDQARALERLSALCDGESAAHELRRSVDDWQGDPLVRSAWHRYTLIGDVLRSEDLASHAPHDEGFLQALRERMAHEPVILAPTPSSSGAFAGEVTRPGSRRPVSLHGAAVRRPWVAPAAVAAGFLMVAGAALVWRTPAEVPAAASMTLAQGVAAPASHSLAPQRDEVITAAWSAEGDALLMQRNPDLDRYLNAHRQFSQGPALAAPGGVRPVALTPSAP
jgi:sigma-E factor negative regulatory protein RseA